MSPHLTQKLGAAVLALLLASTTLAAEPSRHVRFGLPSPAKVDPGHREDYLISRPQYLLSYNAEKRIPNWVSWQLKKSDISKAARAPFEPDPDLPQVDTVLEPVMHL